MSGESKPTEEELKKYLKDACIFEENMDYDDMLNYYTVIKCSESTAQQEKEKRSVGETLQDDAEDKTKELNNSSDFNFDSDIENDTPIVNNSPKLNESSTTSKFFKSKLSLLKSENSPKLSKNVNSQNRNEKVLEYNAYDSPSLKHKPLDIMLYERKYDLPPYCNPKFDKLSTLQKAKIIHNFHRTVLEKFYKLHCESLNPAPWGKPIPASEKFNGSLERKFQAGDDDFEFVHGSHEDDDVETQEIYTSKHGRQTKRKVYTDLYDDESEFKKSKKDDDKPFEIEKKSVTKRQNLNKLSNQDIMKRSKLFSDPVKGTRSEKLFDLLKQGEKKAELGKPLESTNDEDSKIPNENDVDVIPNSQNSDEIVELKPKEMPFISRRVPPPLRGRKGIGSRRQLYSDVTKSNTSSQSSATNTKTLSSSTSPVAATSSEKNQKSTPGKRKCPICSETFFQEEIEAHASSCGLFMETESNFDVLLPTSNVKKIKCSICDKDMIMNKDYEVHVADCIKKAKNLDNL